MDDSVASDRDPRRRFSPYGSRCALRVRAQSVQGPLSEGPYGFLIGHISSKLSPAGSLQDSAQVEENHCSIQRREEAELARIAKEAKRQLMKRVKMFVAAVFLHPQAGADDELVQHLEP